MANSLTAISAYWTPKILDRFPYEPTMREHFETEFDWIEHKRKLYAEEDRKFFARQRILATLLSLSLIALVLITP